MKHSSSCSSQMSIGGQGLEFIPCDCSKEIPMTLNEATKEFKKSVTDVINSALAKFKKETGTSPYGIDVLLIDASTPGRSDYLLSSVQLRFKL